MVDDRLSGLTVPSCPGQSSRGGPGAEPPAEHTEKASDLHALTGEPAASKTCEWGRDGGAPLLDPAPAFAAYRV